MNIQDFWQPFEKRIDSFSQLVEVINQVIGKSKNKKIQFAWRGQVNANWPLHSSLYRRLYKTTEKIPKEADLFKEESKILTELHQWGLHFSPHSGRLSILNQLAMLQHYGAPTRLIDVTFNAWVGVWFAVEEKWRDGKPVNEDDDARLFAFDVTNRLINEHQEYRKWEDDVSRPWKPTRKPKLIDEKAWTTSFFAWKPSSLDARIAAQNGGFLFGGVPSTNSPERTKKFQFPKSPNFKDGWWP
ncbi:MAG: FRG domain-containing protein, partial [Ottowia sp.]|nr:FRG domain-containing protein [Ottowia sp.]